MPKEIRTAAEILGDVASESAEATPATEIPSAPPVEQLAEPVPAEAPAAGFEAPPPAQEETEPVASPLDAKQVLSASGSLDQQAPPPPTAKPTQSKEAVITAKPETIADTDEEVIEPPVKAVPGVKTEWRFVKNIQFGQRIILKDGTEVKYKSSLIVVRDPELARKILEVAAQYCIVEQ